MPNACSSAKVDKGAMYMTINTHVFLYEPVFYWEDSRTPFHKRFLPAEYLATLPEYPENPEGRALVRELRQKINETLRLCGRRAHAGGQELPLHAGPGSGGGPRAAGPQEERGSAEPDEPGSAGIVGAQLGATAGLLPVQSPETGSQQQDVLAQIRLLHSGIAEMPPLE